jgi:hypothetical protein
MRARIRGLIAEAECGSVGIYTPPSTGRACPVVSAGTGCPPALGRAALLWALSLELGGWLEEMVEFIVWPLVRMISCVRDSS